MVARDSSQGEMDWLPNGYGISFWDDESVLELDSSDGDTTLQIYWKLLNCVHFKKMEFYGMWVISQFKKRMTLEISILHAEISKEIVLGLVPSSLTFFNSNLHFVYTSQGCEEGSC